jgi:hypothetical protein
MNEGVPRRSAEVGISAVVESSKETGAANPTTEEAGCAGHGSAGAMVRGWAAAAL